MKQIEIQELQMVLDKKQVHLNQQRLWFELRSDADKAKGVLKW